MFKITEETREAAIEVMTAIFERNGDTVNEAVVGEAFDAAVEIVKKQFGM